MYEKPEKKCPVCGYIYQERYAEDYRIEIIQGDEPFVEISTAHKFIIRDYRGYCYDEKEIELFGCPKCKSVIWEQ